VRLYYTSDVSCDKRVPLERGEGTVFIGIIEPQARTLDLPLLVRSGSFFFFYCPKPGLRGSVFAVRSPPRSKRGNTRRLSARFNYSSKYRTTSSN